MDGGWGDWGPSVEAGGKDMSVIGGTRISKKNHGTFGGCHAMKCP